MNHVEQAPGGDAPPSNVTTMEPVDTHEEDHSVEEEVPTPRQLPADLPKSLDDRRDLPTFGVTEEIYDAWQGQSQFLSSPILKKSLDLALPLDGPSYNDDDLTTKTLEDSENRLVGMLAAQAAHREDRSSSEDEDGIATDDKRSSEEKRETLQKMLNMAASNGDVDRIQRLVDGKAKAFVDVNAPDEDGTAPLIYASCFGHQEVVQALLNAGANVDIQDGNQWSPLMWAMTNRHKAIAKMLLDHGASPDAKSSSGRTAFDFVAPNSELSDYLQENGYKIGNVGVSEDFYNSGFSQDRFEEEMAENELKRRMMMESAMNLEVDLSSLGLDEQPESPDDLEGDGQEFVWDRCLNDQMFVFQESELGRILDIIITNMTPQRSPSQKPVPANILFLSARYAHYHASHDLLATLLVSAMTKINDVVERHQWDMTILAFWISNATLLLHYLKKDTGLVGSTTEFQLQLAELINEIFILIIRDAERRMDKHLDAAMLDHETIPGFEDVHFQNEWRIFRSKTKVKPPEPAEKRYRPPSPRRRMQASPRNITSLLSSTLFVLDLYDIHSFIISQVFSQLLYWLGAELFNRVISNRKYLARTKAMQIRMNVSTLEDWARTNNRQPEHYEKKTQQQGGSLSLNVTPSGENFVDAARRHLAPVIQLLQWLQCFSSLGEDFEALVGTIQQLPRLSPTQLIHVTKRYRPEVGEKGLTKDAMKYLVSLQKETAAQREKSQRQRPISFYSSSPNKPPPSSSNLDPKTPTTPSSHQHSMSNNNNNIPSPSPALGTPTSTYDDPFYHSTTDQDTGSDAINMDPALMLPFSLPTSTDMLVKFGAGFGGVNRERERKYLPTLPPEFLAKLDQTSGTPSSSSASVTYSGFGVGGVGIGNGNGDGDGDITDGGGGTRDRNGSLSGSFERIRLDDDDDINEGNGNGNGNGAGGTKNGFR
ncbi:MAG: hypothetical protein M1823_003650 [Watsoniomyces obsoletus]|nr:MAG: hypothetical protein M1823_003650 [Watsoniomyces obsoletus]